MNLGCGTTFSAGWRNLDIDPKDPTVEKWQAQDGIPAITESVDIVYHSHMLEHLSAEDGKSFLTECFRVLKPKGILRIAVPDLECICREYLAALVRIEKNEEFASLDAKWMRFELFDQMTREDSGGQMLQLLNSQPPNRDFILKRCGEQVAPLLRDKAKGETTNSTKTPLHLEIKRSLQRMLNPTKWKNFMVKQFLGDSDYTALIHGRFLFSGELHKTMYDRFSLAEILLSIGFHQTYTQTHTKSLIPAWKSYRLDCLDNEKPRKPDSLYIEATKSPKD